MAQVVKRGPRELWIHGGTKTHRGYTGKQFDAIEIEGPSVGGGWCKRDDRQRSIVGNEGR